VTVVGLIIGLVCLFIGGDWLVRGASRLAQSFGISALVVGLTVVAFGTSTPELLVSVSAALSGSPDITVGNVVGSNISNIGLILGLSGLIYPIAVHVNLLRREIPIMLAVTILVFLMFQDTVISRVDGLILVVALVLFIVFMIVSALRDKSSQDSDDKVSDTNEEKTPVVNRGKELFRLLVGIVVLMAGAQLTVENATTMARLLGVSELVIGVTLVAVGTSLPELVTSIMAAIRQESDIAIGNVVGSNIFNLLSVLGITALIQPINVPAQTIQFDAIVMLAFTILMIPFALDRKLGRIESLAFLLGYVTFTIVAVLSSL